MLSDPVRRRSCSTKLSACATLSPSSENDRKTGEKRRRHIFVEAVCLKCWSFVSCAERRSSWIDACPCRCLDAGLLHAATDPCTPAVCQACCPAVGSGNDLAIITFAIPCASPCGFSRSLAYTWSHCCRCVQVPHFVCLHCRALV